MSTKEKILELVDAYADSENPATCRGIWEQLNVLLDALAQPDPNSDYVRALIEQRDALSAKLDDIAINGTQIPTGWKFHPTRALSELKRDARNLALKAPHDDEGNPS